MNKMAKDLNLISTHFANPHGILLIFKFKD